MCYNEIGIMYVNIERYLCQSNSCLLYTSDAADEGLGVDLGGRRIIKKKFINKDAILSLIHI